MIESYRPWKKLCSFDWCFWHRTYDSVSIDVNINVTKFIKRLMSTQVIFFSLELFRIIVVLWVADPISSGYFICRILSCFSLIKLKVFRDWKYVISLNPILPSVLDPNSNRRLDPDSDPYSMYGSGSIKWNWALWKLNFFTHRVVLLLFYLFPLFRILFINVINNKFAFEQMYKIFGLLCTNVFFTCIAKKLDPDQKYWFLGQLLIRLSFEQELFFTNYYKNIIFN